MTLATPATHQSTQTARALLAWSRDTVPLLEGEREAARSAGDDNRAGLLTTLIESHRSWLAEHTEDTLARDLELGEVRRRRLEDLVDQGRDAFDRGEDAVREWARQWWQRRPPPKAEERGHLWAILESWQPPEFKPIGGIQPDGSWVEHEPPENPRLGSCWRKRVHEPAGFLARTLALRVQSRRRDGQRRLRGRGEARPRVHGFDESPESFGTGEALLAAAAAEADQQGETFAELLQAAEAKGLALSPREREVALLVGADARHGASARVARQLGIAASTVRVLRRRARQKLAALARKEAAA